MIPIPSGVRVWISTGHTDMRRGMQGLALTVQESLKRDPHAGDLYIFRGRRGDLVKILWHDGIGMSLYAKRLEKGYPSGEHRRPTYLILPGFGGAFPASRSSSTICFRLSMPLGVKAVTPSSPTP